jgi:hypothetical protein
MSYSILSIPLFDKQAKRLAKKHPSLKKDLADLISHLELKPDEGTPLGNNFYKIRWAVSSKGKGKSGGVRIITYVKILQNTVYLSSIYDKSEKENITDKELDDIFNLVS